MKHKNMVRIFAGVIMFFAFVAKVSAYEVSQKEEKSFKIKFGGEVTVIGNAGYIKVKSWDKQEVQLRMVKRAWGRSRRRAEERLEEIEIEINHNGNRLLVRQVDRSRRDFHFFDIFDPDRWREGWWQVEVNFDLTVPKEINLRLENDEGDVEVSEVTGNITITVDEGRVHLENIVSNNVKIETDEGEITCYRVSSRDKNRGKISIDADEGRIRIDESKFRKMDLFSDEADLILNRIQILEGYFRTDEGDIELDMDVLKGGRYRIRSDEGDIFIVLPEDVRVSVNLESEEGYIRTDFPLSVKKREEGERARGVIGKDRARLDVYTEEGDIALEKR